MSNFTSRIRESLTTQCGVSPDAHILVALSGGADSVALLVALAQEGYRLTAAHCNFGLRGEASDGDEEFVRKLCSSLEIPLEVLHPDVPAYMKAHGVSLEMACRDIRYAWFEELRTRLEADAVAVAHHRDDNLETFMLNAFRGTGIAGLRGMLPRREPAIVRPMLSISRADIEQFLNEQQISWRHDASNDVSDVKRNKIRNQIMPTVRAMFPEVDEQLGHTISCVAAEDSLLRTLLSREQARFTDAETGEIDIAEVTRQFGEQAPLVIYEWLKHQGVTFAMAADICANPSRTNAIFGDFILSRGKLANASKECPTLTLASLADGPWQMELIDRRQFKPERNPNVAYFDASILQDDHLWMVRARRDGDRIRPFGMKGTRLISDVYSDAKLPPNARLSSPILFCDGNAVWIPGVINSALYPVTPSSAQIVKLTYHQ